MRKEFYTTCCGNNIKYMKTIIGMRKKQKNGYYTAPSPLTDILVKYVFELRRTCTNHCLEEKFYQHTFTLKDPHPYQLLLDTPRLLGME